MCGTPLAAAARLVQRGGAVVDLELRPRAPLVHVAEIQQQVGIARRDARRHGGAAARSVARIADRRDQRIDRGRGEYG
jgi:hypothetical protein